MTSCDKPYTNRDKWIVSLISGLLFMLIASPFLFASMNQLTNMIGLTISSSDGCPNMAGLIIHGLVFVCIVRLMMR